MSCMKIKLQYLIITLLSFGLFRTTQGATITWTNAVSGDWSVPANWSPNQVPGANDTALINTPGSYSVSVSDNESVSNLILGAASGTLTLNIVSGTFTVHGTGSDSAKSVLVISGGVVSGAGSILVGGPLNWSAGNISAEVQCSGGNINVSSSSSVSSGGELINNGNLTWTPNSGPRTGQGSVISNATSGVISVALNGNTLDSYVYGGAAAFYNAGQINVSGSGQSGSITDPFFNTGTLSIQSGTLNITAGYSSTNGTLSFGLGSLTSFGQLAISGPIAMNGTLSAIANGYTPRTGDSFPLITYGSQTGIFNTFNLPPRATWSVNYAPTTFSINVDNVTSPFLILSAVQPPLPITSGFELLLLGPAGSNYTIQATTSLHPVHWTALTNFTTTHTSFYFTDTGATNQANRFYRAYLQ